MPVTGSTSSGIQPKLAEKAASALPQSTTGTLFTVSGGKCAVKPYGEVTTVLGAGANLAKLTNNTGGTDVDLCATLDIDADAVGTAYNLSGVVADPMYASAPIGAFEDQANWIIVQPGTIDANCNASRTGQWKWSCLWFPIDSGASIS